MKKSISAFAKSKYVRVSPKKTAIILDLIRGKSFLEAEKILKFTPNKAAKLVLKTLKSAGANASNNNSLKTQELLVEETYVGAGPMLKRARIVGRGRTSPILKRTSHIFIGLGRINR